MKKAELQAPTGMGEAVCGRFKAVAFSGLTPSRPLLLIKASESDCYNCMKCKATAQYFFAISIITLLY